MTEYNKDEVAKEAQEFSWDKKENLPETSLKPEYVNFSEKNYTILLVLNGNDVDVSKYEEMAKNEDYDAKSEFHLTVAGFKNGKEIKKALANLSDTEKETKSTEIQNLINEIDWTIKPHHDAYKISKEYSQQNPKTKEVEISETRESIIQMVDVPGVQEFYDRLNQILDINLEAPPTHITLYTKGSDREKAKMGIGINTESELEQLSPIKI